MRCLHALTLGRHDKEGKKRLVDMTKGRGWVVDMTEGDGIMVIWVLRVLLYVFQSRSELVGYLLLPMLFRGPHKA